MKALHAAMSMMSNHHVCHCFDSIHANGIKPLLQCSQLFSAPQNQNSLCFPLEAGVRPAALLQHQRFFRMPHGVSMNTQAATSTIQAPADGNFYKYGLKPVVGQGIMDATLKRLGTVEIKAMERSNFVKPQSVMYELDGKLHANCIAN